MAKIYADNAGVILGTRRNEDEDARHGAPDDATVVLTFDETTNPDLIEALLEDWNAHTMPGGVLTRDGVAVPIAAPGQQYSARQQLTAAKQTIQSNASGLTTYRGLASPTNAQTVSAVKALAEDVAALVTIVRALIREAN